MGSAGEARHNVEEAEALLEKERRMFAALEASGDVYGSVPYRAVKTRPLFLIFRYPQAI